MAKDRTASAGLAVAAVLPAEPLAVRFMNTVWADRGGRHDDLALPLGLQTWLYRTGLVVVDDLSIRSGDFQQARRLRDACRRVAAHATGDERPLAASAVEYINAAISDINSAKAAHRPVDRLVLRDGALGCERVGPGEPVPSVLASLASATIELFTDPDAPPLLACQAPGCVLYFVRDHPRRAWCSAACGNRARAARHYERRRARSSDAPTRTDGR